MLNIIKQPYNSVWVKADSQDELGLTFMRFQEYYESPNYQFRGHIFTVGQLRQWYSETYGSNSYHIHWIGFNFPSSVLLPFKQGLFDPLTNEEHNLLDKLKYRNDQFYIIGAQDNATLNHELNHALYASNIKYKRAIDNFVNKYYKDLKYATQYILSKGYCKDVLNDELQAYVLDNEDQELLNKIPYKIIRGIQRIHNKYKSC